MKKRLLYLTAALCLGLVLLASNARAAECSMSGDTLTVTGVDAGTSQVLTAGFDAQGRMVAVTPVEITNRTGSILVGKTSAVAFKTFFLSGNYGPVAEAKAVEINATRVWVAEKLCEYRNLDLSQYAGKSLPFKDCGGLSDRECQSVLAVLDLRLINAYSEEEFAPQDCLTRAQGTTILCRMTGAQAAQGAQNGYTDINNADWFAPYVTTLCDLGVLPGTGTFRPNEPMTRRDFSDWLNALPSFS